MKTVCHCGTKCYDYILQYFGQRHISVLDLLFLEAELEHSCQQNNHNCMWLIQPQLVYITLNICLFYPIAWLSQLH